jgi:hypothetical protein
MQKNISEKRSASLFTRKTLVDQKMKIFKKDPNVCDSNIEGVRRHLSAEREKLHRTLTTFNVLNGNDSTS